MSQPADPFSTPVAKSLPLYRGQNDYLPNHALDKILELSENLRDFDVGTSNAYTKSITVTIKFVHATGPIAQMEALTAMFTAVQFVGTLARNLKHERTQRAQEEE